MSVKWRGVDVVECDSPGCKRRSYEPAGPEMSANVDREWFKVTRVGRTAHLCSPQCLHGWLLWNWSSTLCGGGDA